MPSFNNLFALVALALGASVLAAPPPRYDAAVAKAVAVVKDTGNDNTVHVGSGHGRRGDYEGGSLVNAVASVDNVLNNLNVNALDRREDGKLADVLAVLDDDADCDEVDVLRRHEDGDVADVFTKVEDSVNDDDVHALKRASLVDVNALLKDTVNDDHVHVGRGEWEGGSLVDVNALVKNTGDDDHVNVLHRGLVDADVPVVDSLDCDDVDALDKRHGGSLIDANVVVDHVLDDDKVDILDGENY